MNGLCPVVILLLLSCGGPGANVPAPAPLPVPVPAKPPAPEPAPADLAVVERILDEEIGRITREPISRAELGRAVARFESTFIWGLERLMAKADRLQQYNQRTGQPDSVTYDLDRYRTTSPEKVRDAAARTLASPRVEVITLPAQGGTAP